MGGHSYLLTGAVAVSLGATGCGGDDSFSSAPTASTATIAFDRVRTGNPPRRDLAVARADGGGIRVLSRGGRSARAQPTWSPDGRFVAFARAARPGALAADIFVVAAHGGAPRRVTKTRDAWLPRWSPRGATIVFTRVRFARSSVAGSLWAVRVDGTGLRRLTPAVRGRADEPGSFSRTGDRLFFTRTTCVPPRRGGCASQTSAIYRANADGTSQQLVLRRAADPALSPDGTQIAYVSDRDRNGSLNYGDKEFVANELYVMNSDGSGPRRLTRTRELNERKPTWSPDGSRIAFQRGEQTGNAEGTSLFQVNADGTCEHEILADPRLDTWYADPAWRPGERGGRLKCG